MTVKDIMTRHVECVGPTDTLQDAARRMKDLDAGVIPVLGDNHQVVGMLTDRDITIRATADGKDPKSTQVQDVMTEEVVWCFEEDGIERAADLMRDNQIRRLLVMNHAQRLVGIVSLGDLATETGDEDRAGDVLEVVSELPQARP
jgi:CBS domain-containing protein